MVSRYIGVKLGANSKQKDQKGRAGCLASSIVCSVLKGGGIWNIDTDGNIDYLRLILKTVNVD